MFDELNEICTWFQKMVISIAGSLLFYNRFWPKKTLFRQKTLYPSDPSTCELNVQLFLFTVHITLGNKKYIKISKSIYVKSIYFEKATKFYKISIVDLTLHRTNLRWRFRKILWPSQNKWTLTLPYLPIANSEKIVKKLIT